MYKILVNDTGFLPGNNRLPILERMCHWQEKGYAVSLLCTRDAKDFYAQNIKNVDFLIIPFSKTPGNKIILIFEYLKRILLSFGFLFGAMGKYDAVFSLSAVLDLLLFPYFLKLLDKKIKWFVVFDNIVSLNKSVFSPVRILAAIFFKLSLFFLKKADRIFVITKGLKAILLSRGFVSSRLVVTGNALEVDLLPKADSKPLVKCKYDAIYIGRINRAKGVFDMLEVLEIVRKKHPKFLLALIGTGDSETMKDFKSEISKKNLQDNVVLLGSVFGEEKFACLRSSKMFLFLSYDESYGVALLEAVCSGLYCVTYDVDVYNELYTNKEIYMVAKGDSASAAQKVELILQKGDFVNHIGLQYPRLSWKDIAEIEGKYFDA